MKQNVLILGGGYAGLMAGNRITKLDQNFQVTLINDGNHFIERIRNHESAAGNTKKEYTMQELLHKRVRFLNARILKIHPKVKQIELENSNQKISYDFLIYSLGSNQSLSKGVISNVITRKNAKDLSQNMSKNTGMAWVIGGGLTGIELATELKESYPDWKIGIVTREKFGQSFSLKGQTYLRKVFSKAGIEIQDQTEILGLKESKVYFANGMQAECQLLIDSTGFSCSEVGRSSGLPSNLRNQIFVNEYLQVPEYPNIFVAGDSCYLADSNMRMGCVTAMPMGVHAAENIHRLNANRKLEAFRFRFVGRCVSLGRKYGLIQMVDEKDSPLESILTGKIGSYIKELICKYTLFSIQLEKWLPFRSYKWPKNKKIQKKIISVPTYE
ncbi:NADH-quinone oxidoreductase subunit D [Leptospira ognonensis]|uniref:NADH-quinone oxidoreductase subunit D n=1 Tax=Leptospira ognonensis TaxID=2484945 RepID=A0A4V6QM95_9LEPT|nr:FAD-dependent oxidoreductase [Leptospira ognonensis]TGL63900.1 NADH-quinone oxidoreductase subunit D [Leptospira ognonensis]